MLEFTESTPILTFPLQGGRNWFCSNGQSGMKNNLSTKYTNGTKKIQKLISALQRNACLPHFVFFVDQSGFSI